MTRVLDASALLAFLQGEDGAAIVEGALADGARIGAANWSEVSQKVLSRGGDWALTRALLTSYGLVVDPVTADDAQRAAELWRPGSGLSLADRLCLALGERLGLVILTADRHWGESDSVRQVR